jgi:hypothetical protein
MSLSNVFLKKLDKRLPDVISPRTHGFIDYPHSALFLAAGVFFWKRNKRAAIAALATGGFVLVQSLLTDYPLGVAPVLSFRTHGRMDAALVGASFSLPRFAGFSDKPEAWLFKVGGVAEAFVVAMTDFDSARAHEERLESTAGKTLGSAAD